MKNSHIKHKKEMDMLNGGLAGKLILFAIPLAFSSILQQLFNSADVAVVGRFAGDRALAAVGSCVAIVGIYVNLLAGLAVGPNAVLATLIGQKKRERINSTLHTVITFGILLGIGLMAVGMLVVRIVLEASGTPTEVMDEAMIYIRIYLLGVPFMLTYNFGSAVLRSYGDTRRPMYYLLISGSVNVVLNLVFVIGCHLGVAGVAIATAISNVLSTAMVLTHLYRRDDEFQFRFHRMKIEWKVLKRVLAIGIPAGVQGAIFSVSNVFIQTGINSFGADAIAGSSLALNFEYFTYDISAAFGQAAVTFVSQNYGAGNIKRCKKIFWLCMLFGFGFTEILSVIFMIYNNPYYSACPMTDGNIKNVDLLIDILATSYLMIFERLSEEDLQATRNDVGLEVNSICSILHQFIGECNKTELRFESPEALLRTLQINLRAKLTEEDK